MQTVLITGASRGIGAKTAELFAMHGYRVIINYNNSQNDAKKLLSEIIKNGGEAEIIKADVSDSAEVNKMFSLITTEYGGVDILINNAGIAQTKLFTDITDDDWSRMISVNLSGAFYCCRSALPYMIRQHYGRIINISSIWGQVGGSCEVHYSASKAGIIGLTKALAMEEGLSGITVNCIAPGVIKTDMTSSLSDNDFKELANQTPTGTIGTTEDIARTAIFLADKNSSYITGQVIGVNGGFTV